MNMPTTSAGRFVVAWVRGRDGHEMADATAVHIVDAEHEALDAATARLDRWHDDWCHKYRVGSKDYGTCGCGLDDAVLGT